MYLLYLLISVGYDGKFLIRSLCHSRWQSEERKLRFSVLATSSERIRQLKLGRRYVFRDSREFIPGSLATAVEEILKNSEFPILNATLSTFYNIDATCVHMVRGKLPFPYETFNGPEALTRRIDSLVPSDFDSKLSLYSGTEQDVATVCELAKVFQLTSLGDLCRLYCLTDTALLGTVLYGTVLHLIIRVSLYLPLFVLLFH